MTTGLVRGAAGRATAIDFDGSYTVPADLQVVQRDATTVQIGTERPRRMLLVDAPAGAGAVLSSLNGAVTAGEVVTRCDGDPLVWRSVLGTLLAAGLLVPAPPERPRPPHLLGERLSLTHRHGPTIADRLLAARADALVVVDGTGPVADAIAALLAASGIGHVHHRVSASRGRARRGRRGDPGGGGAGDVGGGGVGRGAGADSGGGACGDGGDAGDEVRGSRAAGGRTGASTGPLGNRPADGVHRPARGTPRVGAAQAPAWLAAPDVRVHRPAPQMPPSAVVLAGQTLPDLARAAELATAMIPHLAVRVTQARVIVGPLVLPGRSACLNCVERQQSEADPGWSAVASTLRTTPVVPATLLAQGAADLAAGQILDLIDGLGEPASVGATIERQAGTLQVRRRAWPPHPECGCRLLSGQL